MNSIIKVSMYIIAVYDVNEKRVKKVHEIMSKFLEWVQRSVFKGKLTKAKFILLKEKIKDVIDINEDSVIFFILEDEKSIREIEIIGKSKGGRII